MELEEIFNKMEAEGWKISESFKEEQRSFLQSFLEIAQKNNIDYHELSGVKSLKDLDGKTVTVRFKVKEWKPNIYLD